MKRVAFIAAGATMLGALAGCAADPYYNTSTRYGYYPSGYAYSYPSYAYSYPSYAYSSPSYAYPRSGYSQSWPGSYRPVYTGHWDYYRNYKGIHPGPEYTM